LEQGGALRDAQGLDGVDARRTARGRIAGDSGLSDAHDPGDGAGDLLIAFRFGGELFAAFGCQFVEPGAPVMESCWMSRAMA